MAERSKTFQGWISHPDLGESVPARLCVEHRRGRVCGTWSGLNISDNTWLWNHIFNDTKFQQLQTDYLEEESTANRWVWKFAKPEITDGVAEFNIQGCLDGISLSGTLRKLPSMMCSAVPMPVAKWDFRQGMHDKIGKAHGMLHGDARFVKGHGVLFSGNGFVLTEVLDADVHAKTLEVWVELATLDQEEAGIMGIGPMDSPHAEFDSVVYNERQKKQWMAGSDFYQRTQSAGGNQESNMRLLNLTISYASDGTIAVYRDGMPYGSPYNVPNSPPQYYSGVARVLFGARHIWKEQQVSAADRSFVKKGAMVGRITHASLYDTALSAEQVMICSRTGIFQLRSIQEQMTWEEHLVNIGRAFPSSSVCEIPDAARRGITLAQLGVVCRYATENCHKWRRLECGANPIIKADTVPLVGPKLDMTILNLYDLNSWLVLPATKGQGQGGDCSFVELIASTEQAPTWFVSHWWGEPIADFRKCLLAHAVCRALHPDSAFWVCAYANRQHSVEMDLNLGDSDLTKTSFYRAMMLSSGLLLVLDAQATPFKRVWCAFEAYVILTFRMDLTKPSSISNDTAKKLFDLASCQMGKAQLLTDGVASADETDHNPTLAKADREMGFSLNVIRKGLCFKLTDAEASNLQDRERILQWMDAAAQGGIEAVNHHLRAIIAVLAWRQCILHGAGMVKRLRLPARLQADKQARTLDITFSRLWQMADTDVASLANGLPETLERVNLNFEWCYKLTDASVNDLSNSLQACSRLHSVVLNIRECTSVTGRCLAVFARNLPASLRSLHLKLHKDMTDKEAQELASSLRANLEHLHLSFRDCANITSVGATTIAEKLPREALQTLGINFDLTSIGDDTLRKFAMMMPQTLKYLCLSFVGTAVTQNALAGLERELLNRNLTSLPKVGDTLQMGQELQGKGRIAWKLPGSEVVSAVEAIPSAQGEQVAFGKPHGPEQGSEVMTAQREIKELRAKLKEKEETIAQMHQLIRDKAKASRRHRSCEGMEAPCERAEAQTYTHAASSL